MTRELTATGRHPATAMAVDTRTHATCGAGGGCQWAGPAGEKTPWTALPRRTSPARAEARTARSREQATRSTRRTTERDAPRKREHKPQRATTITTTADVAVTRGARESEAREAGEAHPLNPNSARVAESGLPAATQARRALWSRRNCSCPLLCVRSLNRA